MRIGMLIDRYKPYISGITNYVSINKSFLEKAGHEVFVFTFGGLDYPDDEPEIHRSIGLPLLNSGYYLGLDYKRDSLRLLHTMHVAHVHHPFISGQIALRHCRPRGIPIVYTVHTRYDLYTQAYLPMFPESMGEAAMRAFLPFFCSKCDLVVAPTEGMRKVLEAFGVNSPVKVIPNGVDLQPFFQNERKVDRASLGLKPDDFILIYVGRIAPEKNLDFLLQCFTEAACTQENLKLLLVGEGPEFDPLVSRCKLMDMSERIIFTGLVPYDEISAYLRLADAFITTSLTEVHPLSLIEAMATGLPVIGIDSPGVGDLIIDEKSGFLADNNPKSLVGAINRLVQNPELKARMSQHAREQACQYDIKITSQLMIDQYQTLKEKARYSRRRIF